MVHNSRISARINALSESTTLKIDAKAKALRAEGRPVISFAAGEPNFPTPKHIVDAAREALDDPQNFRYSPAAGLPELRSAIAQKTARDSNFEVDPAQVIVTNGGKQAIYEAIQALVDPGDEVILPTPYWTTYPEVIRLAGGTPVEVFAGTEQGFKVNVSQLEAARNENTKVLMFVSPSNPTGAVYSREETRAIGEWAYANGIWVIADEIYQNLTYGDVKSTSILDAVPALADQTVLVNGVAKTYAMTGWRVGWMVGPHDVIRGAANLQSHLTSNINNIAQRGTIAALGGQTEPIKKMREAFEVRRGLILDELAQVRGFKTPKPDGAFYAFVDVSELLGSAESGFVAESSLELAEYILTEIEVAVVPGEAFGAPGYLRFSYALDDESLVEGIQRIQKLLNGR